MKVYDSQGRLKVVGFTGPAGPAGTQSVTCAELSDTASVLAAAIDVVSNGLSALIVDHDILSNRVSVNSATGGTGSATSAEVQVASAAATSVDGRVTSLNTFLASISARSVGVSAKGLQSAINAVSNTISNEASARAASVQTASAAATSVDGRIASLSAFFASLSVRSAGVSTHGLQSILNTLSDRISAATGGGGSVTSAEVQVASAAATSADAHANAASAAATSADAHANTVSARVVSVSAELVSLVQITSAAATSADAHANAASAAATSVDAHVNTVSARVVSVSAELVSLVQIASAAATSADGHANTVSARAVSISAELASLVQIASAAATSADGHANTASAAATSVNARVNSVNVALSAISARSAGNVSTHGLQSVIDALSNRISGVTGGAGSVTSTELSVGLLGILQLRNDDGLDASAGQPVFVGASAASTFRVAAGLDTDTKEAIGMVTSTILIGATGSIQTRGILSLTSAQWDERTGQTGGLTTGSKYYLASTVGQLALTPAGDAARVVGVAIAGDKMLLGFNLVDDARPYISTISARAIGDNSVHGFQSVVNALSGRIDANSVVVSVTSQELSARVQTASAAATSADGHANTASAAATSVNARVNSVNTFISAISTRSVGNVSTHGLQSVLDALSNRISAGGGTASVTSAEVERLGFFSDFYELTDAVTFQTGENQPHTAVFLNGFVYATATVGASSRLLKFNATNLAEKTSVAFAADGLHGFANQMVYAPSKSRLYILWQNADRILISQADPTNLSVSDVINDTAFSVGAGGMATDDANLFVATGDSVSKVVKYELTAFALVSSNTLDRSFAHAIGYDGTNLFATYQTSPAAITRISPTDLTFSSHTFDSGDDIATDDIAFTTNHAWVGLETSVGTLLKVDKADITSISRIETGIPHACFGTFSDGTNIWAAFDGTPGFLARIDPTTDLVKVFNLSRNSPNEVVFTSTTLYVTGFTNPGTLARYDTIEVAASISRNALSALSQSVSAVSNQLSITASALRNASTIGSIAALSLAIVNDASVSAVIKADINSVSAAIRADEASHIASTSATIKADIASVSAVIKADINSVSAAIMADAASHLASTSATIKADINSVSAAIRADEASHIASTSATIKADIASVSAAIKTDIASVSAAILNDVASRMGSAQFKMVTTGAQAVATATFTKVSGLSLSIVGSGFYIVEGQLVWSQSGAGSASAIFNFGMSMTAQPVMAMFKMEGNIGALAAAAGLSSWTQYGGNSAICATPSIMYSAKPNPGASGSVTNTMFFNGVLQASTAQSQLKVVVACSTAAFGVAIQPGSWIRAYKIG